MRRFPNLSGLQIAIIGTPPGDCDAQVSFPTNVSVKLPDLAISVIADILSCTPTHDPLKIHERITAFLTTAEATTKKTMAAKAVQTTIGFPRTIIFGVDKDCKPNTLSVYIDTVQQIDDLQSTIDISTYCVISAKAEIGHNTNDLLVTISQFKLTGDDTRSGGFFRAALSLVQQAKTAALNASIQGLLLALSAVKMDTITLPWSRVADVCITKGLEALHKKSQEVME